MWQRVRAEWGRRPAWMNALLLLCAYMALFRVPLDFAFTATERDEEVWLGFVLRGSWAKATEPLHWAIYAAGAWGFWKMRPWMRPWAAAYAAQVAVGTAIWNLTDPRGAAALGFLLSLVLLVPAIALWRSRERFASRG